MQVQTNLAEIRKRRGISVAKLAAEVEVTRQTIYAIEGQKYVPNTLLALRLAEFLEVSVEELFSVQREPSGSGKNTMVEMLDDPSPGYRSNLPLKICMVGSRRIGVPVSPVQGQIPDADAVLVDSVRKGRATARIFRDDAVSDKRLLLAGCDPAIPALARYMLKQASIEVVTMGCSSTRAMHLLQDQKIHIGGTHLSGKSGCSDNLKVIHRFFPKDNCHVATFASWAEGLVVAKGNPRKIKAIEDLGHKSVRIINREVGAGSRFLLDSLLKKSGVPTQNIRGYKKIAKGHILAAWHVQSGLADCCVATEASARVFGLDFIPLVGERFDLVVPDRFWSLPTVQALMDALNRSSLRRELEALGGYDTSQTGNIVH